MILGRRLPLGLDTLLLLLLVLPHLWFNPASSGLLVVALAVYVALDLVGEREGRPERFALLRFAIVMLVVLASVLLPAGLRMIDRAATGPATNAHDGLIQTEEAIRFLLEGRNPYVEDYVNTPMADFPAGEPPFTDAPLYHNAYLPFLFLVSLPLYAGSHALFGWYDQRLVYLPAFFAALLLLASLIRRPRLRLALLAALGLNYLWVFFLADGRNDVMILLGLAATTVLLDRDRPRAAAFALGLTMTVKHSAWFFVPFFVSYLWPPLPLRQAARHVARQIWPLFLALALVLAPFIFWDAAAFVDDTLLYIAGSGPDSFPIKGWGFSQLMLTAGVIPDAEAAFPFVLFELAAGLPLLAWLWRRGRRQANSLAHLWFAFASFSFVVQFFSRFFSDNYAIFILQALIVALFLDMAADRPPIAQPGVP